MSIGCDRTIWFVDLLSCEHGLCSVNSDISSMVEISGVSTGEHSLSLSESESALELEPELSDCWALKRCSQKSKPLNRLTILNRVNITNTTQWKDRKKRVRFVDKCKK
jgi:hypothetical protein